MRPPSLISYLGAAALILVLWEAASYLAGELIIPGPGQTLAALGREVQTRAYWVHVGASAYRICLSLALAFVTAAPLGLALGGSRRADRYSAPLIYLSYPIPKIVLLPVILLIFGLGNLSKVFLIALIIFFQVLITTRDSARQVTKEMRYSVKSLGADRVDFFRHVLWPVCLPGVFTSLRIGVGTAVAVLFFVESIGSEHGLGLYIINAWGAADSRVMFVGIVSLSALGVILYEVFDLLEKRFCRWKYL
ncbi:MAG: ABC transporter permease [Pseudomonadota bacterium]